MRNIGILLVSLLMMTSCLNDFLEVKPETDIASANFWQTPNDARTALNAAYTSIQTQFQGAYGYNFPFLFEARADNFIGRSNLMTYPFASVQYNIITSTHPTSDWNSYYKIISIANYALHYIPQITALTDVQRDHFLSEAYFLRAYSYFQLVRLWGDVPMITEPVLTISQVTKPVKTSKVEIDNLISSDLKLSVQMIDETANSVFLYNAGAVYALCTDFSMWIKDYQSAVDYSKKMYDLNRYTLVTSTDFYKVCGDATTTENIWTLKWNFANNGWNRGLYNLNPDGTTYIIVAEPIKLLWGTPEWRNDIRRPQCIDTTYTTYASTHIDNPDNRGSLWKWAPKTRLDQTNEKYYPLYRFADIILLRAEALNKLGRTSESLAELKKIRDRAKLPERTLDEFVLFTDQQLMDTVENIILQERQFELIGEGKRWFDLVRTGKAMSTMNNFFTNYIEVKSFQKPNHFTDEWQLYWPVYFNNIQENENLEQTGNY